MSGIFQTLRRRGGLFLIRFGVIGAQLIVLLVLAALMQRSEFGAFAYGWAAIQMVGSLISLGGPGYLLREMSARQAGPEYGPAPLQVLLIASAGPALLALIVWFIIRSLISHNLLPLPSPDFAIVIVLGGWLNNLVANIAVPIRVSGAPNTAMFYRDGLGHLIVLASGFSVAATAPAVSALRVLEGYCALAVLVVAAGLVIAALRTRTASYFGNGKQRFSLAFWASGLTAMLAAQIDILIGGLFLNPAHLGSYQILRKAANLLSLPQIIANWSIAVEASKAFASGDRVSLRDSAREGLMIAIIPAIALGVTLVLASPALFSWYHIPADTNSLMTFLILTTGGLANVGFGANFLIAAQCHLEHLALRARLIALFAGAVFLGCLSPALGTTGVAVAMATSTTLMNVLIWLDVQRRLGVDTSIFSLLRHRTQT